MAKVIAYQYEARGIRQAITSQDQLTKAIRETNKALKGAEAGTEEYDKLVKQQAELKNAQAEVRAESKRAQRDLVIAADQGRGSVRALTASLKNLEEQYNDLAREDRRTARGLQLLRDKRDPRGDPGN